MTIQRKAFPVEVKTAGMPKGQVEALVSVFGNVDLGGDRVIKGAFAGTIGKWKADGRPVPVVFSHKWDDPWAHIGAVDHLEETEQGLKAVYTLDVDDNPLAAHIYRLMKRGSLKEHSFAYSINKEKRGEDGAVELHDLDLIEVGPTLKGMNPDTELLSVKSALEATAGRKFDDSELVDVFGQAKDDDLPARIQAAVVKAIQEVFSSPADEPNEKSDEADDVKADAEDVPASDMELLKLQRQINQLRS
jgi:HK97 family phage prohead protease